MTNVMEYYYDSMAAFLAELESKSLEEVKEFILQRTPPASFIVNDDNVYLIACHKIRYNLKHKLITDKMKEASKKWLEDNDCKTEIIGGGF